MSAVDIVDTLLADLEFVAPVEIADCTAVYAALKEALPRSRVEVYFHTGHPTDKVVIRVDQITRKVTVS